MSADLKQAVERCRDIADDRTLAVGVTERLDQAAIHAVLSALSRAEAELEQTKAKLVDAVCQKSWPNYRAEKAEAERDEGEGGKR